MWNKTGGTEVWFVNDNLHFVSAENFYLLKIALHCYLLKEALYCYILKIAMHYYFFPPFIDLRRQIGYKKVT